jgi:LasA protease
MMKTRRILTATCLSIILVTTSCVRPQTNMKEMWVPVNPTAGPQAALADTQDPIPTTKAPTSKPTAQATTAVPPTQGPTATDLPQPTPDSPRVVPTLRTSTEHYTVRAGDTLAVIARRYSVDVNTVAEANGISNPNLLSIGLSLVIPPPSPRYNAPDFKIIPDAELVYGPKSMGFDVAKFIHDQNGYLDTYREKVDGEMVSGATIVERVSQEHSVNPRLLLAILDYQSGWVTSRNPDRQPMDYPLGFRDSSRAGLYKQLFWAGNNLNRGFYGWQTSSFGAWVLIDGSVIPVSPVVNSGTAAVQYLMSLLKDQSNWYDSVAKGGVFATFNALFGYPFDYTLEPLVPKNLKQPSMQLPFEKDVLWYFTGGPHMGWDDGSPAAALDFAPTDAGSCNASGTWETAVADGVIARSGYGSVVLDLDGDGYEGTGWTVLYLHVAGWERIKAGTKVHAGDRIGHASCEGGFALVTHLHIARRYNGVWILADGAVPFVMDGWVPEGTGTEYDGYLKQDGEVIEAWDGRSEINKIWR